MKKLLFGLLFFISTSTLADINSDLNSFFKGLGLDANVTNPSAYRGQEAGYYTGGSVFARNTVRDFQLVHVDLPSYRSGCGGIDLFTGGFSFIDATQLVEMLKNILNNAKGYAFTLAMESVTPEIANVMKYLNDVANKINSLNVNSCETAADLVGSVWPKTQESQRRVCADIGSKQGIFADYAAAKQGCGNEGHLSETLNKGQGAYKNIVFKEGNIAWKAIQQNGFLQSDEQLAELFMSLSGTIIVRQNTDGRGDEASNNFSLLPSLAASDQLLKALLHGGYTKIYRCNDTENCLELKPISIEVYANSSLNTAVRNILNKIVQKIHENTALEKDEIGFLQATRLPVYKMLNVQAAFYQDPSILDVSSYSEVIATDILFQYLNENLDIIKASSGTLQYPEEIMRQFMAGIEKAKDAIRAAQKSAYSQIAVTNQLIQQTQMIEQILAGQLSTELAHSLSWARGMH